MAKQLYNILRVQQKFSHLFNNLRVCVVSPSGHTFAAEIEKVWWPPCRLLDVVAVLLWL